MQIRLDIQELQCVALSALPVIEAHETSFERCRSFKRLCGLLHLAAIIAAGSQQAKQPASRTCEREAAPSALQSMHQLRLNLDWSAQVLFLGEYLCHKFISISNSR